MKGLTAKVFRTYNASATFQRLLDESDLEGATLQEKLNAYNKANRLVAILCNHQRSVPKTHDQSMEKMRQKVYLNIPCQAIPHVFCCLYSIKGLNTTA